MFKAIRIIAFLVLTLGAVAAWGASGDAPQSPINPAAAPAQKYPKVVLYSTAWCPHCKEAKEYFTKNNIPFINRDVELDDAAMTDLTKKYKSQGVPVIVIGNDEKIIKGFSQDRFEKALQELQKKK